MKFFCLKSQLLLAFLFPVVLFLFPSVSAREHRFTVVLDAGHGGHDPGAVGSFAKEKDINLAVVLDLGDMIEHNYPDVNVVYTRKTDKYLTLQERADVVNDHHADLFICVHTNSSPSPSATGSETFTLGLAKTKSNLDVAMRENSVILLEDNYKSKYSGFDPASVDSYIMFEFMQDKYIDHSIEFSSDVQKELSMNNRRTDRGVRQAGFWVLHRSACPSVLIELGFITNSSEEHYMCTQKGQEELAHAIFNAFGDYKKEYERRMSVASSNSVGVAKPVKSVPDTAKSGSRDRQKDSGKVVMKENVVEQSFARKKKNSLKESLSSQQKGAKSEHVKPYERSANGVIFKVQLFASDKKLSPNSSFYRGVNEVDNYFENGMYKYTIGNDSDYSRIDELRKKVSAKFPQAFIIGFRDNKKLSATEINKYKK